MNMKIRRCRLFVPSNLPCMTMMMKIMIIVMMMMFSLLLSSHAMATSSSGSGSGSGNDTGISYQYARNIRIQQGHDAAVPIYRQLLLLQKSQSERRHNVDKDVDDFTAATRIAAASSSPQRHDRACPIPIQEDQDDHGEAELGTGTERQQDRRVHDAIAKLRSVLYQSQYDNRSIQQVFGIEQIDRREFERYDHGHDHDHPRKFTKAQSLAFARGPVYITPIAAGSQTRLPSFLREEEELLIHLKRLKQQIEQLEGGDLETEISGSYEASKAGVNDFTTSTSESKATSSLKCLVALFLLGFAVPRDILSTFLIGGEDTIQILEELGLAFPCEMDPNMVVPYVHIFPLEVDILSPYTYNAAYASRERVKEEDYDHNDDDASTETKTLLLVTDCHPRILSRTTVGENEDGAVMYIGPDSLALVQHLPLHQHLKRRINMQGTNDHDIDGLTIHILDFCTGSGIQALSTLASLERMQSLDPKSKSNPAAKAVCVDYNQRALRFTKFNALLNGLDIERMEFINSDLISGELLCGDEDEDARDEGRGEVDSATCGEKGQYSQESIPSRSAMDLLLGGTSGTVAKSGISAPFDVILANPPFIPVPGNPATIGDGNENNYGNNDDDGDTRGNISKRYGLFSSGGSSGEEVLQSIVSMSSRLLRPEDGMLAIVSEFMNPSLPSPTVRGNEGNNERADGAMDGNDDDDKAMDENNPPDDTILHKLHQWWYDSPPSPSTTVATTTTTVHSSAAKIMGGRGILFTNEYPVSASTYASRRADDEAEYDIWMRHLEDTNIRHVSPGMLYIRTTTDKMNKEKKQNVKAVGVDDKLPSSSSLDVSSSLVPRDDLLGSIWTPYNHAAVSFTHMEWENCYE